MGLDMYLNKKSYYGGKYKEEGEHNAPHNMQISGEFITKERIDISRITHIEEQVGYWRKANAIHNWFVQNIQDGQDDCGSYSVGIENLKELLEICKKVKAASNLVEGQINNGYKIENGIQTPIKEDGKFIADYKVAQELLPPQEGFFFGSTDYDEYYLQDVDHTIEMIEEIIAESKDDTCYPEYEYQSSW